MAQLPAHLANRQQLPSMMEAAVAGLGGSLPPHISIQGNAFTLIDATGAEQPVGNTLSACIIDISPHMCKQYYGKPWTPGSNDPPLCWSANGVGPSREAAEPQSQSCAACPHNVRGSAVSALSGASIKACRDEKWLALLLPQYPGMLFQLRVTPGSFKNWGAYTKPFEDDGQIQPRDVLTTFGFQAQTNGVLTFQPADFISDVIADARDKALRAKATDTLVGRTDVPIRTSLQARADLVEEQSRIAALGPQGAVAISPGEHAVQPASFVARVTAEHTATEPQRRRRRTQAEMQAAQQPTQLGAETAPVAPFRAATQAQGAATPFGQPATPAGAGPQFGISPGVAPNPEMMKAIDAMNIDPVFGKK